MEKIPETAPKKSVIHSQQVNCQESVEVLFKRMYLSSSVSVYDEFDHPPVTLRYMVDDYWELLIK